MFIQVVHEVLDAPAWDKMAREMEGRVPTAPGVTLHSSVTAQDHSKVFCLWEAGSIEAVSSVLDPMTQGVLRNTYYAIDASAPATSLPHAVA